MNEFEGKTKIELQAVKITLLSYKQGCVDTYQYMIDLVKIKLDDTVKFYDEKITSCNQEIIRRESEE